MELDTPEPFMQSHNMFPAAEPAAPYDPKINQEVINNPICGLNDSLTFCPEIKKIPKSIINIKIKGIPICFNLSFIIPLF